MKVVLDPGAFMPEKAHPDDAGYDLFSPIETRVPGSYFSFDHTMHIGSTTIDTGVHIAIPKGYVGMIKSKSGLNVKHGLTAEGVIDSGYTGSICVKIYNHSSNAYRFERGDKIAQLVIMPISDEALELVDHLDETERGDGGFGSTGR